MTICFIISARQSGSGQSITLINSVFAQSLDLHLGHIGLRSSIIAPPQFLHARSKAATWSCGMDTVESHFTHRNLASNFVGPSVASNSFLHWRQRYLAWIAIVVINFY